MNIYWVEQTEIDVPAEGDWLSAGETTRLREMRFTKRRSEWRLGRWTAKSAVAAWLNLPAAPVVLAQLEIRTTPGGAPEVFFANRPAPVTISISHRESRAMCAVARSGVDLGCDLETIEPRSDVFVRDYFTVDEQAWIMSTPHTERDAIVAMLWSVKESALKAMRIGLRMDTTWLPVTPGDSPDMRSWRPLHVSSTDGTVLCGWWQQADTLVRTVVADPPPDAPLPLYIPVPSPARELQCV